METYFPVIIFVLVFVAIVFEVYEKAVLAVAGALLMVIFKVLSFEEAIEAIDFNTILLLMSMMLLVEVTKKTHIFSWITLKLVNVTKGNPVLIYTLFCLLTAGVSAFLDNVTTILLIAPISIALLKGMGKDPKLLILLEIMFSNIGGTLTIIGDPPNIIIGTAAKLKFNDFILNMWMPVLASIVVILGVVVVQHWQTLKPISKNLKKLFITNILIEKLQYKFLDIVLKPSFIAKTICVLLLTILGFLFESKLHMELPLIALAGAFLIFLLLRHEIEVHKTLEAVEWSTLFFFAGLFIVVAGVEQTGLLERLAHSIVGITDDYTMLLLIILWISGIVSMFLDNIPFITVMVPVIFSIQKTLDPSLDPLLLWWALSLGGCLGGNGTLIGASANVVGVGLAKKEGIHISFMEYLRFNLPLTLLTLVISTVYLIIRS